MRFRFCSGVYKRIFKKYHLDSNNIVFELSETTSIEDKHLFKQAVRHYRSQGFEIAIDDVGSGYSNLNRINHTQPEYIKLDKELIQDIHLNKDKHTMGEVMVNCCKAMHYKLIVEGIETKEELECLIQLGIEYGQGYYLKKPVDNFDDLLPDIKETIKKLYNKYKKTLDIPTIDSLCHFPCTLKTYQNINNAYQIFEENNTTQRIYVINDEGHYLGYLKRENILCDLDIVEPNLFKDSLIVPSHLPIKNVCQLFLENEHSHFYEDIIVLKNQCFYGIVTIKDLLKYLIK
ncbi:EAL domain-containing protein [Coprobacillus sp. AF37-2]|nr:EAL domain-containing protein [Coprobacillus sp. AF37-2]